MYKPGEVMHYILIKEFYPSTSWHPDVKLYWSLMQTEAHRYTQELLARCKIG